MKFIKWLLKSVLLALLFLFLTNIIGRYVNINIPINLWTILTATIFRLPGVIILIIFFLL